MIVFGKNKYLLKSFKPSEFGLPTDPNDTDLIVVYQRYAHLYFIPLFSLGKIWALKRGDALFELTPEFQQFIHAVNPKLPSGWLAFSWFWLLLVGGCIFKINGCSEEKRYANAEKTAFIQTQTKLQNRFDQLQVDDYLRFKVTTVPKMGDEHTFGRVKAINGDSLVLEMASLDPIKQGYMVIKDPAKMMKYLMDFPDGQLVKVSKSALRASFCLEAANETQCAGFPLHSSTKNLFWINEISHPVALEFAVSGLYMNQKTGEVGKSIENKGLPVTILQVQSLGKFKYNGVAQPHLVEAGERFAVKGSGEMKDVLSNASFEFSCRDAKGKIHWFQVSDTAKIATKIEK
jgi:hypothetical protein